MRITENRLRYMIREILLEHRDKSWYRVIADVYSDLPYFVLQDVYSQEKHGETLKELIESDLDSEDNSFDKLRNKVIDLWGERKSGKEILGYLLSGMKDSNYHKGVELIKSWESGETSWDGDKSVWWNVNWKSNKPKIINLHWSDLIPTKTNMWKNKYLSEKSNFNILGPGGSFTKTLRMFRSLNLDGKNEPAIFIIENRLVDIIGGNNRTFNLFFKEYCNIKNISIEYLESIKNEDDCRKLYKGFFDYIDNANLSIKINCYIGQKNA